MRTKPPVPLRVLCRRCARLCQRRSHLAADDERLSREAGVRELSLWASRLERAFEVVGMVAVITAVLAGCVVSVLAVAVSDSSATAALAAGVVVGAIALVVLMKFQRVT